MDHHYEYQPQDLPSIMRWRAVPLVDSRLIWVGESAQDMEAAILDGQGQLISLMHTFNAAQVTCILHNRCYEALEIPAHPSSFTVKFPVAMPPVAHPPKFPVAMPPVAYPPKACELGTLSVIKPKKARKSRAKKK